MVQLAAYVGGISYVIFSTVLNSIIIYVFARKRNELMFNELLMLSMAVGDVLQTLFGYTTEMCSILLRKDQDTEATGLLLCKASGFIVTFLALASIAHLTVIAYDQYLAVCKPFLATNVHGTPWIIKLILFLTWIFALAWSIFPLFGWSSYELEADSARCSIHWSSPLLQDKIYLICLFMSCYFLPVIIMIHSFIRVKKELRQMQVVATNLCGRESMAVTETVKAEKKHTRLALLICAIFVVMWLPYALISFWAAFFQHVAVVAPAVATAAALIAKSSTVINPIIYSFLHKRFQQMLRKSFIGKLFCCQTVVHPDITDNNSRITERT